MWKYVSRRVKDTFERSVNYFDKRSTTGLASASNNSIIDNNNNQKSVPSCRSISSKCWNPFGEDNNTNSRRWNYDHLNYTWLGAITWSSALVLGWYASQLVHLKNKYRPKDDRNLCLSKYNLYQTLSPYVSCVKRNTLFLETIPKADKLIHNLTPIVHSVSNDHNESPESTSRNANTTPDSSDDIGDVLNSIENRLGLAAIESGRHQDGLQLLRSAANRNHAPALYNLGLCYELGLGVKTDEKMAMELYRSAAALEHPGAMYNLGIYYGQGRGGLSPDTVTATRLLRLAAVKGQEDAINALKSLDTDATYPQVPCQNDVIAESSLYFNDVNPVLHAHNCEAAVF